MRSVFKFPGRPTKSLCWWTGQAQVFPQRAGVNATAGNWRMLGVQIHCMSIIYIWLCNCRLLPCAWLSNDSLCMSTGWDMDVVEQQQSLNTNQWLLLDMDSLIRQTLIPTIQTKACVVAPRTLAHVCADKQQAEIVKAVLLPYHCSEGASSRCDANGNRWGSCKTKRDIECWFSSA